MKLETKVFGKDEEILQKATRTIVNQVTAMKQMVDDFRLYAKIGSPRFEEINLAEFVQEVTNLLFGRRYSSSFGLGFDSSADRGRCQHARQVLHNLISNAMEAAPDKEAMRVEIRVAREYELGTNVVDGVKLEVIDNGPGFAAQILEHAFEPYVTTKTSGTGLGLPMIKKNCGRAPKARSA